MRINDMMHAGGIYALAPADLVKSKTIWLWVIRKCPFCGKKHTHGGMRVEENPYEALGARVPHCENSPYPHEYVLVPRTSKYLFKFVGLAPRLRR